MIPAHEYPSDQLASFVPLAKRLGTCDGDEVFCVNCGMPAQEDNDLCDRCVCPSCGMLNPTKHMCTSPCG